MTQLQKEKNCQCLVEILNKYNGRSQEWKDEQEAYFTLDHKGKRATIIAGLYEHKKKMGVLLDDIRNYLKQHNF